MTTDAEERIALALSCLVPVYRLAIEAEQRRRWWRPYRGPAIGTLILAERVRRALTESNQTGVQAENGSNA